MTLSFLRQRVVRVLTRPPEILYALSRHWMFVLFCLLVGAGLMWGVVVAQPVSYEGRAQLLVSRNESILATLTDAGQTRQGDYDMRTFLSSQSAILQSDSVVRNLILCRGFSWSRGGAETPPAAQEGSGSLGGWVASVFRGVSEFLLLRQPPLAGASQEEALQNAIERFKLRAVVLPNLRDNTIDLLVYGTDHDVMRNDLRCWIEAYKIRLAAMAKETWEDFLAERGRTYARRKEAAYHDLQAFKESNPDVSESRQELLSEQIGQIYLELSNLRQRMTLSGPTATALQVDPEYTRLVAEKNDLEMKLVQLEEAGFSENSAPVRPLKKRLELATAKLLEFEGPIPAATTSRKADPRRILDSRMATLEHELKGLYAQRSAIIEKLKEYEDLERKYESASENLDSFEAVKLDTLQLLQSPLNVQVSDEPAVDPRPVGLPPVLKLSLGGMAGLIVGMGFAIVFEILCGRVRFKHDLIDDFGLPVVSVLPR